MDPALRRDDRLTKDLTKVPTGTIQHAPLYRFKFSISTAMPWPAPMHMLITA